MVELKNIGVQDSVVEQLMGQIRNMEDTISSILVALEYGPDMGTSYRLNQGCIYTVYNNIQTIYKLYQGVGGGIYTIKIGDYLWIVHCNNQEWAR